MAELDNRTVVVTNGKTEREISASAWNLCRSAKERGNTRKGWTFLRYLEAPSKGKGKSEVAQVPTAAGATYIPPEVAAAASQAAAEATMLAGEHVTPEQVLSSGVVGSQEPQKAASAPVVAPEPSEPPAPAESPAKPPLEPAADVRADAAAAAAAAAATHEGAKDDLQKVKNVGPKTEQVMNGVGIFTYAQLRDADEKALADALDANGLSVKKALIPHWKKDAGQILNPSSAE